MGTLASAIAQLENVNPSYNNPGAISGTGDTGTSFGQGIGIYSTLQAGQAALENQLSLIYSGSSPYYPGGSNMTLQQFGEVYAPNQNYGNTLASILGIPSSTTLANIPSGVSGTSSTGVSASDVADAVGNNFGIGNVGTAVSSISGAQTSFLSQAESYLNNKAHDVVVVVVGIILIAAGVFAFKQTQTVIDTATRVGRRIGEVAGA
jgi:hypothetical protein